MHWQQGVDINFQLQLRNAASNLSLSVAGNQFKRNRNETNDASKCTGREHTGFFCAQAYRLFYVLYPELGLEFLHAKYNLTELNTRLQKVSAEGEE